MWVVDRIKRFFNVAEPPEPVISDDMFKALGLANDLWQYQYALSRVSTILKSCLINTEWRTFTNHKIVKKEEWYRFNYAPNQREPAATFYGKLADKLIADGEALIVEMANGDLFIADSFSFKNGTMLQMRNNTFVNVAIGNESLNRNFKENSTAMYIRYPKSPQLDILLNSMQSEYAGLKKLIKKGALKAMGTKYNLNVTSQAKLESLTEYLKKTQEAYGPLMDADNAVFVTYKGETLTDMTEKQRGSEVEQIIASVANNITINHEIVTAIGNAYGIPNNVMLGNYKEDGVEDYSMMMTVFAKPILSLLSQTFSTFTLTKESIIAGGKIEANLNKIKFKDALSLANSVDKLVSSSSYLVNEVREMLGDEPTEDGHIRLLTKNYDGFSKIVNGKEVTNSEIRILKF